VRRRARRRNVAGPQYSGGPEHCQPSVHDLVYRLVDRVASVILPSHCVLCGAAGAVRALDLCTECEADLPWIEAACPRCGLSSDDGSESRAAGCLRCEGRFQPHHRCHAALQYEFPATDLVAALKYRGALTHARVLGTLLAESLVRHGSFGDADLVVPMPLHASRLTERGFNQAFEIARFTAGRLRLAVDGRALRREHATAPQVGLAREQRAGNVRGAFTADASRVAGRHVALLDDVVTTGATAAAAAQALLEGGARCVDVWCVARAA
jgi:ComF family protein